jgi:hypothetical protein
LRDFSRDFAFEDSLNAETPISNFNFRSFQQDSEKGAVHFSDFVLTVAKLHRRSKGLMLLRETEALGGPLA